MSLKSKIKNLLAAAACITTLLGPTVNIEDKPEAPTSIEEIVEYSPSISLEMPKAEARDDQFKGRLAVLGFDVLFNGLKSGIGAKYNGDDFWPAFAKGAVSGLIVYSGKEIASRNSDVPFAGGAGKLIHDLGVSMSDSVMNGEKLLSRYRTGIGPIEFDFNKGSVDLYVHPISAGSIIYLIARGDKFDVKNSLYNLTPVFYFTEDRSSPTVDSVYGMTYENEFTYKKGLGEDIMISHEMNHVLVGSEFRFIDDLMGKKSDLIKKIPIIWSLAPIFDHMKFGSAIGNWLLRIPHFISPDAYFYVIPELEAYSMQRPGDKLNAHPFYRK